MNSMTHPNEFTLHLCYSTAPVWVHGVRVTPRAAGLNVQEVWVSPGGRLAGGTEDFWVGGFTWIQMLFSLQPKQSFLEIFISFLSLTGVEDFQIEDK